MEQYMIMETMLKKKGAVREAIIWQAFRKDVQCSGAIEEVVDMILDVGVNLLKLISWNREERLPIVFKNEVVPALQREAKSVVFYGDQYKAVLKLRRDMVEIRYQKLE